MKRQKKVLRKWSNICKKMDFQLILYLEYARVARFKKELIKVKTIRINYINLSIQTF